MTNPVTQIHETVEMKPPVPPERIAWMVLITSFLIFCSLCAVTSIGLQYFLFQSRASIQTVFQPGRGTPGVRDGNSAERTVRNNQDLRRGAFVRTDMTDDSSQASLLFVDTSNDDQLIAVVTLKGDTSLLLEESSRPRFNWNSSAYDIELTEVAGEIEIIVAEGLVRNLQMDIWMEDGTRVIIRESGTYIIETSELENRIANRQGGDLIIIPNDSDVGRSLTMGNQATIQIGSFDVEYSPYLTNLLANSQLRILVESESVSADNQLVQLPATGWGCTHISDVDSSPRGLYGVGVAPDSRTAFHFLRLGGATTHGETGCEQNVADSMRDISDYNFLEMRATLYIDLQSVPACGIEATECPLMLQIDYTSDDGGNRVWRHGIYAEPSPSDPLRCDTCLENHVRIYRDAWYTYESGNLFQILTIIEQDESGADIVIRPRDITQVRIYASGHEYDVYVSEVSLLAGTVNSAVVGNADVATDDN